MSSSAQTLVAPALKNILFATDFSPCSQAALPYVRSIAERYASTVHAVHVLAPEPQTVGVPLDRFPELDADRYVAQSEMDALLASHFFDNLAHTETIERGKLWEVLVPFMKEKSIDLVVLGTHGRRGLKKLVLGSAAEQVFRHATCPVLTVGPHATQENAADMSFKTILYATDFSSGSQHALAYALSLARANRSHLILLHALPVAIQALPGNMDQAMCANWEVSAELVADVLGCARRQVAELISDETIKELEPEIIVECEPAAEMILRVAESKHAALIVMGAHRAQAHSVAAHLPWATASAVVCRAPCPVLTVRS
jgi:nucleotide-binding universal stress UspA family protein